MAAFRGVFESGYEFSSESTYGPGVVNWGGNFVTPGRPCNFEALLEAAINKKAHHLPQGDENDLFGLSGSPLSSAPSSANPSPPNSPLLLPIELEKKGVESLPDLVGRSSSNSAGGGSRREVGRRAYKKLQSRARRKRKREEMGRDELADPVIRPAIIEKHVASAGPVKVAFDIEGGSAASTAYVGVRSKGSKTLRGLDDLVGDESKSRLKYVAWEGRNSLPLVDSAGRIVGVGVGNPKGCDAHGMAAEVIEKARSRCEVSAKDRKHRRGHFIALRTGVSHGQGQKQPGVLKNNAANSTVLGEILEHEAFRRLSRHITTAFKTWAPKLYSYYVDRLGKLYAHGSDLKRIFSSSVFAAASVNFGPRTICFPHKDHGNLPFGWCAITALGSFNAKKGGHLVLRELGLVIEFPAGSTFFIPSAVITHSNTPIGEDETRYSFTQYTAGSIFRYVEHGLQGDTDFYAGLSEEEIKEEDEKAAKRWEFGIGLFSSMKELSGST